MWRGSGRRTAAIGSGGERTRSIGSEGEPRMAAIGSEDESDSPIRLPRQTTAEPAPSPARPKPRGRFALRFSRTVAPKIAGQQEIARQGTDCGPGPSSVEDTLAERCRLPPPPSPPHAEGRRLAASLEGTRLRPSEMGASAHRRGAPTGSPRTWGHASSRALGLYGRLRRPCGSASSSERWRTLRSTCAGVAEASPPRWCTTRTTWRMPPQGQGRRDARPSAMADCVCAPQRWQRISATVGTSILPLVLMSPQAPHVPGVRHRA
jgi:hypothetical protein